VLGLLFGYVDSKGFRVVEVYLRGLNLELVKSNGFREEVRSYMHVSL
jgi:hypothetical protein